MTRRVTVRTQSISLRLDMRVLGLLGALGVATLLALTLSVGRGDFPIAPLEVLSTLTGAGDEATRFVVLELRLPRALTAVLTGIALGIAGAIFQDLARNPLVSPDIIGISAGASFAAVSLIVLGDTSGVISVPLAALGGAIAAGVALYLLAWRGGVQGYRLVLVGIGVAALLHAGIDYVFTRGQIFQVAEAYVWLVGSLNARGWEHVWPLAGALAVLLPLALALGRQLEVLQLGDDVARALGIGVERARLALLAVAVVLTGIAVSAAGPIAFVAFIAPHIARRICGTVSPSGVLPVAAATGALLVLSADLIGRLAFAPNGVPVGIVTAIIAAPYFLLLLRRANLLGATG
ncbi:MAG: iron chelate uptake ABC transporter family permease subunit [Solirubrobacteraceae bacterium]|nr:iron chelate uptake ABC transporter family permease subunit [Solirubrobacteraceae bacterium]